MTDITDDEMIQAWRCILNTIRDELSLTCLLLHQLGCYGRQVVIRDKFRRATIRTPEVSYNSACTDIPIHEWINNLRLSSRIGRGMFLPGDSKED
ncbi:hypothetical protein N7488_003410 [Penicillium malachiteum]|nr:hypothetical protein N7488_003410 [Penicillium malachiteum]